MFALIGSDSAHSSPDDDCRRGLTPEARVMSCTTLLSNAALQSGERAKVHRYRAAAFALLRQEKKAVSDYSQAIELNPNYGLAYVGRGHTKLAMKDIDGAISDYTTAIAKLPRYASVYTARGYALLTQGKLDDAIEDFKRAINIAPDSATAYNNLALAQRKKGLSNIAIESYNEAIRINPLYALAYANRGHAYESAGLIESAISDFRTAIFLDPSLSDARRRLKKLGISDGFVKDGDALVFAGRTLAGSYCSRCHAIGRKGKSRHKKAPPFRVVQNRHPVLALRTPLERTIAYPHDDMPKFKLSDDQIDSIIAYINSLQITK